MRRRIVIVNGLVIAGLAQKGPSAQHMQMRKRRGSIRRLELL
jgi:hypothetical protein